MNTEPHEESLDSNADIEPGFEWHVSFNSQYVFRPRIIEIESDIGKHFVITDIKCGAKSQFSVAGMPVPCDIFFPGSYGAEVIMDTLRPGERFEISIRNVSNASSPFKAKIKGAAVKGAAVK